LLLSQWKEIPALRMLSAPLAEITDRARLFQSRITGHKTELIDGESVVGGGATPAQSISTKLIAIQTADTIALEKKLRSAALPVVARIENDRVLIDLRTVSPGEEDDLLAAIQS